MKEDIMKFEIASTRPASIKVIGVGGGGGNAVNHMFEQGIKDVDFILCNTDSQALAASAVPVKIQLGEAKTQGRGAGNNPERGKEAAEENSQDVESILADNTQMVFITAGMGGGTGTGAAPIIAKIARELNILTVAVVSIPFRFEGPKRVNQAIKGIEELRQQVDSLLIINNEKIREIYGNLELDEAFAKADDVLSVAVKGIAEIITVHGMINVDFADVQTVMANSGVAIMGSGKASGENRARTAIEEALTSPLLNNANIRGTKNILLNITSGSKRVKMDEVSEITDYIREEVGYDVDTIWGYAQDETLGENINVTIIATGFEINALPELSSLKQPLNTRSTAPNVKPTITPAEEKTIVSLETESIKKDLFDSVIENIFDSIPENIFEVKNFENEYMEPETPKSEPSYGFVTKTSESNLFQQKLNFSNDEPETQLNYHTFSYQDVKQLDDITDYENVSAFKRKGGASHLPNNENESASNISRFTLSDSKDGIRIKEKNSFIHDNVD